MIKLKKLFVLTQNNLMKSATKPVTSLFPALERWNPFEGFDVDSPLFNWKIYV